MKIKNQKGNLKRKMSNLHIIIPLIWTCILPLLSSISWSATATSFATSSTAWLLLLATTLTWKASLVGTGGVFSTLALMSMTGAAWFPLIFGLDDPRSDDFWADLWAVCRFLGPGAVPTGNQYTCGSYTEGNMTIKRK